MIKSTKLRAKNFLQHNIENGFPSSNKWCLSDPHVDTFINKADDIVHQVFIIFRRGTTPRNKQQPEDFQSPSRGCCSRKGVHGHQARDCKGVTPLWWLNLSVLTMYIAMLLKTVSVVITVFQDVLTEYELLDNKQH